MLVRLLAVLLTLAPLGAEPAFVDRTADLGLTLNTGPAAWLDFDNDGRPDLNAGGALWLNRGETGFEKLAATGNGVGADFDNDGWVDLFLYNALRLLRNDGGVALVEAALPELPRTISRAACWADLDGDGFVDLYVAGYEHWDDQLTFPDLLLTNRGGAFELTSADASRRARGVTACDFDRDGDVDVYVSNYRLQPNRLWLNDGAGTLSDAAAELGALATSEGFRGGHSIGACWGDFDNDGWIDLFAGNFAHVDSRGDQPKSRFLRNVASDDGGRRFDDKGPCGVHYQESYATPAAADYDNDGDLDLFFTTVYGTASFGRKNQPVLFRNDGDWTFTDVTEAAGLAGQPPTYQAAWADVDDDGDLDLAAGGKLWINQGTPNGWLKVRLEGDGARVDRSAIGTQIRVIDGEVVRTRQVEAGTGEGNQNELTLHVGLGPNPGPQRLEILWPTGETQVLETVTPGQTVRVRYGEGR